MKKSAKVKVDLFLKKWEKGGVFFISMNMESWNRIFRKILERNYYYLKQKKIKNFISLSNYENLKEIGGRTIVINEEVKKDTVLIKYNTDEERIMREIREMLG